MKRVFSTLLFVALASCYWQNYQPHEQGSECVNAVDCGDAHACKYVECVNGYCKREPLLYGDECTTYFGGDGRCKNDKCVSLAVFFNYCDGVHHECTKHSDCKIGPCRRAGCIAGHCEYAPNLDAVPCVAADDSVGECQACECVIAP